MRLALRKIPAASWARRCGLWYRRNVARWSGFASNRVDVRSWVRGLTPGWHISVCKPLDNADGKGSGPKEEAKDDTSPLLLVRGKSRAPLHRDQSYHGADSRVQHRTAPYSPAQPPTDRLPVSPFFRFGHPLQGDGYAGRTVTDADRSQVRTPSPRHCAHHARFVIRPVTSVAPRSASRDASGRASPVGLRGPAGVPHTGRSRWLITGLTDAISYA